MDKQVVTAEHRQLFCNTGTSASRMQYLNIHKCVVRVDGKT